MEDHEVNEFLEHFAPSDVNETIRWLSTNGYALASHRGGSTFGAQFVYTGEAEVVITVDQSQWMLDIAPRAGDEAWQYDLLIAAQAGRSYGEMFPKTGTRRVGEPLPEQLPEGVRWHDTLPSVLAWICSGDVAPAAREAQRERTRLMWSADREG